MPSKHIPICPKCGYDQSGTIATWSTKCPVEGTCPECGLEFEWANIFDSKRANLHWYIKHLSKKREVISRTLPTLFQLLNPFKFWKRLSLQSPISLTVLIVWFMMLAVFVHIAVSIPNGVGYYNRIHAQAGYWANVFNAKGLYAYPELAFNMLFKNAFGIYSRPGTSGLSVIQINFQGWLSVSNIILRPASFSFGFNLMWLIVLLLVPTTRRLAKIRSIHVCRAFVLSMICTLIIFQAARLDFGSSSPYWRMHTEILGYRPYLNLIALWQLLYWAAVIRIGWQIRQPKLLLILGTTSAILAGLLLNTTFFILPDVL